MPPWKITLTEFSLDDILSDELALKNQMKAINIYLLSFIDDIQGRYNSWDILPILMGWILCQVTLGWKEFLESKRLKCVIFGVFLIMYKNLESNISCSRSSCRRNLKFCNFWKF
jgi:hypothetical protein